MEIGWSWARQAVEVAQLAGRLADAATADGRPLIFPPVDQALCDATAHAAIRHVGQWPPNQRIAQPDARGRYLDRWYLTRGVPALFLHWFHASDPSTAHDHPWAFVSLLVRGVLRESSCHGELTLTPGAVVGRAATHRHRLTLIPRRRRDNDGAQPFDCAMAKVASSSSAVFLRFPREA